MNDKLFIAFGAALVAIALTVVTGFAQSANGSFVALNNSNVTGNYRFERVNDNQTRVTVTLQGMEANSTHAGHFHEGTSCSNIGPISLPLNSVRADGNGQGSITQVVNSSLDNIQSGRYLISYHQTNDSNSGSIACSEIARAAATQTNPTPTSTPNTSFNPTPSTTYTAPNTGFGGMSR